MDTDKEEVALIELFTGAASLCPTARGAWSATGLLSSLPGKRAAGHLDAPRLELIGQSASQ